MTYIVTLAERDHGYGLYPLDLATRHPIQHKALAAARQLAHEHGYMPRETTDWERGDSSATTQLVCY